MLLKIKTQTYYLKNKLKETSHFNFFKLVIFTLFFFPSITFNLLQAEIFPWVIIFVPFYFRKTTKFFFLILFFLVLHSLIFTLYKGSILSLELFRSLLSYFNSLIPFAFLISAPIQTIYRFAKLTKLIFYFLIILGLLQNFNLFESLDSLFKFFIPRSSSSNLDFMNRGVTLLSSEPARAGNSLLFIYFSVRYLYTLKQYRIFFDLFMFFYLLLIIQSTMSFFVFLIFIIFQYRFKLIIPISLIVLFLLVFSFNFSEGGRAVDLGRAILDLDNLNDISFLLVNSSGHRLLSIYSYWLYALNYPFGGGIGNWLYTSVESLINTGINPNEYSFFQKFGSNIPFRASGFFTNLALDTGIFGFLFVFSYVLNSLKKFWKISSDAKVIILVFLIKVTFIGSVGHPVAWITTAILLRCLMELKTESSLINISSNG